MDTPAAPITFASRDDRKEVENALLFAPKFDADGLIPCVTTDSASGEVLMVAYMNEESLKMTIQLGEAVYYSRSRQEIWHKGATSGQIQKVKELRIDCDQDCIVLKVEQTGGGCCHTGNANCFYRQVDLDATRKEGGTIRLKS
jgi:phosphoribosyl-AMP cyclohydrolase